MLFKCKLVYLKKFKLTVKPKENIKENISICFLTFYSMKCYKNYTNYFVKNKVEQNISVCKNERVLNATFVKNYYYCTV